MKNELIETTVHFRATQSTLNRAFLEIQNTIYSFTMPDIFTGLSPKKVDMWQMAQVIEADCKKATIALRVGMMRSSHMRVKFDGSRTIEVFHVLDTKADRLWLTISAINQSTLK